ncbi:DUF2946 domain-containing protein [Pseudomonas citronellolis]|uniref:DUF2946 domain-containing protein n=1 Tax=Pseudomonas citronellolis TaxID=53408 RepID=UPI0023E40F2D|nr:DUF2946 domain-containing protein [Pseudomonas citronellolis]MDF3932592.1 DUF2946 domain-containing protein [Pseudomonas citronellolis]
MAIWLALFAMLMIHLGPLLSQSMPMDHAMPAMADMAGMDAMACSEHARSGHHDAGAAQKGFAADHFMEKCGYCGLLLHSPALQTPRLALSADLPGAAPAPQVVIEHPIPPSPVFPGARSRAPPSLIA